MTEKKKTGKIKLIMGANSFGDPPPTSVGKYFSAEEVKKAIAICRENGIIEFDTARIYTAGNSEATLGDAIRTVFPNDKNNSNVTPIIATKAAPNHGFTGKDVYDQLNTSLQTLKMKSVDIFYLHAPDGKVPLEDTLSGVDRLYREGKFKEFGLSNYLSFQVAQIYFLCKIRGYVLPTVYQGIYSLLSREAENELFLVLRQLKMRFYAFSPLAGGLLVAPRKFEDKPQSGRFSRAVYFGAFWKQSIFEEVDIFSKLCHEHKLPMREVAMRWILNHSALKSEYGDGVILGASALTQIQDNINITKGGPLNEELVTEIDKIWMRLGKSGANLDGQWRTVQPISSL